MDIGGERRNSRGKLAGVPLQVAARVAPVHPAVVEVDVRISGGLHAARDHRVGRRFDQALADVALERVPRVPPHRWRGRDDGRARPARARAPGAGGPGDTSRPPPPAPTTGSCMAARTRAAGSRLAGRTRTAGSTSSGTARSRASCDTTRPHPPAPPPRQVRHRIHRLQTCQWHRCPPDPPRRQRPRPIRKRRPPWRPSPRFPAHLPNPPHRRFEAPPAPHPTPTNRSATIEIPVLIVTPNKGKPGRNCCRWAFTSPTGGSRRDRCCRPFHDPRIVVVRGVEQNLRPAKRQGRRRVRGTEDECRSPL